MAADFIVSGGNIRKRPDWRWEARYTTGIDPKTGKQIQKSVYGKTQKEVRMRLTEVTSELDNGTYIEPCKMTMDQWLDDLFEFIILAKSNVDSDLYKNDIRNSARVVSDAWKAKFEQAYQKAKVSFGNAPEFQYIQTLHQEITANIKKVKTNETKAVVIVFFILAVVFTVIIVGGLKSTSKDAAREVVRLEAVVEEIESNLEDGKYKLALILAESLEYGGYDDVDEREWNVKREYLIEQIIDKAAENGVELQRTQQNDTE